MKIEEIRTKTADELDYELSHMKKELFDLRFRSATETSPNPSKIRDLRRSIARIQTVVHERARAAGAQEKS